MSVGAEWLEWYWTNSRSNTIHFILYKFSSTSIWLRPHILRYSKYHVLSETFYNPKLNSSIKWQQLWFFIVWGALNFELQKRNDLPQDFDIWGNTALLRWMNLFTLSQTLILYSSSNFWVCKWNLKYRAVLSSDAVYAVQSGSNLWNCG